jgi:O-antigen/teichoic acid export membrane protein
LRAISFVAAAVVALVLSPYMIRHLGDRQYGFWTLAATLLGYYGLLDFGLTTAITRQLSVAAGSGDARQQQRVFNTAIVIYSVIGAVALAVTGIAAFVVSRRIGPPDGAAFGAALLLLGCGTAATFPQRAFVGVLTSRLRFDLRCIMTLTTLALRSVLVVWTLASGHGLVMLGLATLVAGLPELFLAAWFARRAWPELHWSWRLADRAEVRQLFSYSVYAFVIQLADRMRYHASGIVIGALLGLSAVTHFSVASMLAFYYAALMVELVSVIQPLFGRQFGAGDHEGMARTLFFSTKLSVYVSSFIGAGLVLWGRPFIDLWMGAAYLDAYVPLVWLTAGVTFAAWQIPSVAMLYGTGRHRYFALFTVLEAVTNLALCLWLAPRFGIVGVAIGICLPMAITKLLVQPVYFCRVTGIPYGTYTKRLALAVLVCGGALVAPALLAQGPPPATYPRLVGVVAMAGIAYLAVLWWAGFNRGERAVLLGVLAVPGRRRATPVKETTWSTI